MKTFSAQGIGEVVLTDERYRHILERHPETKPHLHHIPATLATPEMVGKSRYDPNVLLFYRSARKGIYLVAVVKRNARNFILTIYLTDRIAHK